MLAANNCAVAVLLTFALTGLSAWSCFEKALQFQQGIEGSGAVQAV
jgi:hypothetical protein